MDKPFNSAEVISAVGIRLAEVRQSITDSQTKAEQRLALFEAEINRCVAERMADVSAALLTLERMMSEARDRLATLKDGEPGKDGRDGVDGSADLPGRDGKDGIDGKDGEPGRDGVDGQNGTNGADGAPGKDGERGADGQPGRDGNDGVSVDLDAIKALLPAPEVDGATVARMIDEAVARQAGEFAPDEVAESVALAVRTMAEYAGRGEDDWHPTVAVHIPPVNVILSDQPAPVVNLAAPVVNVQPPNVNIEIPKRGKEVTRVTEWDKSGRIKSFEKTEEEQ